MSARVKVQLDSQSLKVAIVGVGIPGPKGDDGAGSGDSFAYTHSQPSASATWTINHNLGTQPGVEVRSLGGLVVDAEVLHISANTAQVFFDAPFAGFAICS